MLPSCYHCYCSYTLDVILLLPPKVIYYYHYYHHHYHYGKFRIMRVQGVALRLITIAILAGGK